MTVYRLFLFLHILGVVLWLGVAFTLPFVTGRAAREESLEVAAYAYRVSDRLRKTLGLAGMLLTVGGGIGLIVVRPDYEFFRPFPNHWLFQMQLLGLLAFGVGLLFELPLSGKLARAAEASASEGRRTEELRRYRKQSAIVGSGVGLVLLLLVLLGTMRPF